MIHTVEGFGVVNKAEIDVFLELSCFFNDPADTGNLTCGSSAFSKTSLNIWKFSVHVLLKPGLEHFEHYFTSMWDECTCAVVRAMQASPKKPLQLCYGCVCWVSHQRTQHGCTIAAAPAIREYTRLQFLRLLDSSSSFLTCTLPTPGSVSSVNSETPPLLSEDNLNSVW